MTEETKRNSRGVPLEWSTTESEARHWRQFAIEDLRDMVAKRYKTTPQRLVGISRAALIVAIEAHTSEVV